ncbi:bacteriohemerythrin [Paraburkholderia unamae]|uniref:Hemerythrin n=1 Tax=Paraburkholderia unamae TaxID=219649 RepID=A0ABX5KHW1_9BURK|nr:hemerythrin domain-containing protein [Paraburkholderia unamae]PVX75653.1 hemerythrin [Paraburkholderia unamae]
MSDDSGFGWTDAYLLGYQPMDATHHEFVECVDALLSANDALAPAALDALIDHARRHFGEERDWMEASRFPARECHIEEHDKVMASVLEVRALVAQGDCTYVRPLARELARWFPGHADQMDSALAQWMVRKRLGGAPVVLRRDVLANAALAAGSPHDHPPS